MGELGGVSCELRVGWKRRVGRGGMGIEGLGVGEATR